MMSFKKKLSIALLFQIAVATAYGQTQTESQIEGSPYLSDRLTPSYEHALIAYQAGNGTIAAREFTDLAAQGNPAADYWLGVLHSYGMGGLAYSDEQAEALFQSALEKLKPLAEQGDPVAQTILGNAYSMGRGVDVDEKQAAMWFDKAIAQNYTTALDWKGGMYYNSQIEGLDESKAIALFKQAGDAGVAAALYDLHHIYENQGLSKLALATLKKSAEMGFARSQYVYGYRLDEAELGLKEDNRQAIFWYHKAAAQGSDTAQNNLAVIYDDGEKGVPQNREKAFGLYLKSAAQDNSNAQFALSWLYSNYKNDKVIGYAWCYLSRAEEDRANDSELRKLAKKMTSAQVAEAVQLAKKWKYGEIISR